MPEYMHFDAIDISADWFRLGENTRINEETKETDIAIKFIAYWIAFNGLYARYATKDSELAAPQIVRLIDGNFKRLKGLIDFDNSPECAVFRSAPVFNGLERPNRLSDYRNGRSSEFGSSSISQVRNYQVFIDASKDEKDRLIALMLTVKQVRNNLFHGQKNPEPARNYQLVCSSQIILKKVVQALIK